MDTEPASVAHLATGSSSSKTARYLSDKTQMISVLSSGHASFVHRLSWRCSLQDVP